MMNATYDISLIVMSRRLSLVELAKRLEREPQSGSFDKEYVRRDGSSIGKSLWRENARDANAPWIDQCLQVLNDVPRTCAELMASDPDDISARLDIGVFFYRAYANAYLPRDLIALAAAKNIDIEISCYPCAPKDSDEQELRMWQH